MLLAACGGGGAGQQQAAPPSKVLVETVRRGAIPNLVELVALYQRTVQNAFREVADGLVGRQRLAEQIVAQEQAVRVQGRLAETSKLRYDNGVSPYLEVLDAQRSLFAAEQALLQLRAAALQNGVSLYAALGGNEPLPVPAPGGE